MATPRLAFSLFTLLPDSGDRQRRTRGKTPEARAAWQVLRYDLSASVNAAERALAGRAVISARNVGEGAGRSLTVRLNPAATVTSAKAGDAAATVSARKDERTNLLVATLSLPATVAPGATTTVTVEYRLPVAENSGFASISPEGAQFLPPSFWYPTPNTVVAPRGADYAPSRLSVTAAGGETIISAGRSSADGFEQPLYGQPFFLAGRWETVEGAGEARGVSAHLQAGAGADERQRAEALVALAARSAQVLRGASRPRARDAGAPGRRAARRGLRDGGHAPRRSCRFSSHEDRLGDGVADRGGGRAPVGRRREGHRGRGRGGRPRRAAALPRHALPRTAVRQGRGRQGAHAAGRPVRAVRAPRRVARREQPRARQPTSTPPPTRARSSGAS